MHDHKPKEEPKNIKKRKTGIEGHLEFIKDTILSDIKEAKKEVEDTLEVMVGDIPAFDKKK